MCRLLTVALLGVLAAALPAQDKKPAAVDADFKPMFNGKDLSGWVNVNCHPDTFFVKDGEIITTGKPTGYLRTDKQYENFVLEVDWMHVNKTEVGNSGLFVWGDPLPAVGTEYTRGIEVQVLVNLEYKDKEGRITATSHGDLFSIWGAKCVPDRPHPSGWERCLPNENRAKGGGEWNHYKVTANDGVIKLEVNGKEVSGVSKCVPRKGYLALESEGAECHFKNLKIKELPSTNPKPEECAKVDEGFKSLFNGMDLTGWKAGEVAWKVKGEKLAAAGKADLVSEKSFGPCELIFDYKLPAKSDTSCEFQLGGLTFAVAPSGDVSAAWQTAGATKAEKTFPHGDAVKRGAWNRVTISITDNRVLGSINSTPGVKLGLAGVRKTEPFTFKPAEGLEIMNVFVRELKQEKK
jgi:hypothetical protein